MDDDLNIKTILSDAEVSDESSDDELAMEEVKFTRVSHSKLNKKQIKNIDKPKNKSLFDDLAQDEDDALTSIRKSKLRSISTNPSMSLLSGLGIDNNTQVSTSDLTHALIQEKRKAIVAAMESKNSGKANNAQTHTLDNQEEPELSESSSVELAEDQRVSEDESDENTSVENQEDDDDEMASTTSDQEENDDDDATSTTSDQEEDDDDDAASTTSHQEENYTDEMASINDQQDIITDDNHTSIREERHTKLTDSAASDQADIQRALQSRSNEHGSASPQDEASFVEMNLSRPLLRAITAMGYKTPTPIQQKTIPLAMSGQDVCGSAVTGSGKTAAFLLPALERLLYRDRHVPATRVLVVTPTRELAAQCFNVCKQLAQFTDIRAALVVGGLSLKTQEAELRGRPDVVICTPGRMLDHLRNSHGVDVDDIDVLVLDEADRLLELGFAEEVEELVKQCPTSRQTLLFSATMTEKVDELAALSLRKPARVFADPLFDMAHKLVQEFVRIRASRERDREAMLVSLISRGFSKRLIVFCRQKRTAHRIMLLLGLLGFNARELHGNLTQRQRLEALELFRIHEADILVCTDLAARGLDITGVETVINLEMPNDLTTYVHRVGRTARAGRTGRSITLCGEGNRQLMKQVVQRASQNVLSRSIPNDVINYWREKIDTVKSDINDILQQERLEKEMRIAERDAQKATNLVEHADEIHSRPARTWFQSEAQKKTVQEKAKELKQQKIDALKQEQDDETQMEDVHSNTKNVEKKKKLHRLTRKKRRKLEMTKLLEKEEARARKAQEKAREKSSASGSKIPKDALDRLEEKRNRVVLAQADALRTQKSKAKQAKRTAAQAAAELGISGTTLSKRQKKTGTKNSLYNDKTGFDTDLNDVSQPQNLRRASFIGGNSNNDGLARRKRARLSTNDTQVLQSDGPKMMKKGGKASHQGFKSKTRFKRR